MKIQIRVYNTAGQLVQDISDEKNIVEKAIKRAEAAGIRVNRGTEELDVTIITIKQDEGESLGQFWDFPKTMCL